MCLYEYNEELHLKEERDIAMEKGIEYGEARVNALNKLLAENNRIDDILLAAQDSEYQKKLLEEFGL